MQCAAGKITSKRQNGKTINISKVISTEYTSKLGFHARRKVINTLRKKQERKVSFLSYY